MSDKTPAQRLHELHVEYDQTSGEIAMHGAPFTRSLEEIAAESQQILEALIDERTATRKKRWFGRDA